MTNATPAAPWLLSRFSMALVRMSLAGPGATLPTLSSSVCVAESPEQAEDRDEGDDRREHRQHAVVGERGGPVGDVVGRELLEGPLDRRLLGGRQLGGAVGRAAVGRARAPRAWPRPSRARPDVRVPSVPLSRPASRRSASRSPVRRRDRRRPCTTAKIAPCSGGGGQDLAPAVLALAAAGESSSPVTSFQTCLKIAPPSRPPSTPKTMPKGV